MKVYVEIYRGQVSVTTDDRRIQVQIRDYDVDGLDAADRHDFCRLDEEGEEFILEDADFDPALVRAKFRYRFGNPVPA